MLLLAAVAAAQPSERETRWYPVDELRAGRAEAPDGMDLSSPRATLRSFLDAFDAGRFERAAAALRLPETVEAEPSELARMLGEVIERQVWLDLATLSDRADAALMTTANNSLAGRPRRSVALDTIDHDRFPVTIRLNRYRAGEGEAAWLFAQQTVAATPSLYERYGPGWMELRLPRWWRAETAFGLRRWEIAALPVLAAAATLVGCAVSALLAGLRRLLPYRWLRRGFDAARTPLGLLAGTIAARTVLRSAVGFSAPITALLDPALLVLMALAVMLAALRVIDAALDRITRRYVGEIDDRTSGDQRRFYTSVYAARRLVTLLAFVFIIGVVLREIDAFADIGLSLLASAGVATVILGVAAQPVLGNILASLQLAIAKPIRIGDSVNYEGRWCYVESIYYTFVRLRSWDERRLIVPVQHFISNPFENWTMTDAKMTETFSIALDHDADTGALRDAFERIAREDPAVMPNEMLRMQVLEHTPEAQTCRFYATAADPSAAWAMHARLREEVLAWIRENHPEWWPRERMGGGGVRRDAASAAAAAAE